MSTTALTAHARVAAVTVFGGSQGEFRLIIAGSRGLDPMTLQSAIRTAFEHGWKSGIFPYLVYPDCAISGCADGGDKAGEIWARTHGIPIHRCPAQWSHGRGAGYARNVRMSIIGTHLIALWDGKSRGTAHMIKCARNRGLPTVIALVSPDGTMTVEPDAPQGQEANAESKGL